MRKQTMSARSMSAGGLALLTALAFATGCGGSGDGGQSQPPAHSPAPGAPGEGGPEPTPPGLPQPSGPVIRYVVDDFPIAAQAVGVETSPTLISPTASPGHTYVGVLLTVRGTTSDRPTPAPSMRWTLLKPASSQEECEFSYAEHFCHGTSGQSKLHPEQEARGGGINVFRHHGGANDDDENLGGIDAFDEMQLGTTYYVEVYPEVELKQSEGLTGLRLCEDEAANPKSCLQLASLPALPKR